MEIRPLSTLSFEEAMQELEKIVRHLEEGRIPLKEAVDAYKRGADLKKYCESLLSEARLKIEEIVRDEQGNLTTKPSDLQQHLDTPFA